MTQDIHAKLAKVAGAIGPINKDSVNKEQHFNFRSIEQITAAVRPLFAVEGVSVAPKMLSIEHAEVVAKSGARGWRALVVMQYTFTAGSDGSSVETSVPGEAVDYGDKSTSKAVQMAYKYALTQVLQVGSGEADPDGQPVEIGEIGRGRQERQQQARPQPPPEPEPPIEEVAPELWNELYALQAVWPSNEETMPVLEARLRRLYELMELCGMWRGGSLHAALRLKAKVEHVSDLRKEALKDFAVVSWTAAQDAVKKLETVQA